MCVTYPFAGSDMLVYYCRYLTNKKEMSNLNNLNGWTGDGGYNSRTSAQSYMVSGSDKMTSPGCGSSCGSKDGDAKPAPSSCGTGDSQPKPSSCGAAEGDSEPKPSSCGAAEGDSIPKTSACGSSCGAGSK
jgi:hypothetical protein